MAENDKYFIPLGILGRGFGSVGNIVISRNGSCRSKKVHKLKPRLKDERDPSGA